MAKSLVFAAVLLVLCFPGRADLNSDLHKAAFRGNMDEVKRCIADGADIGSIGYGGQTALLAALANNQTEAALYLISRGADLNVADDDGRTALTEATEWNNGEVAAALVEAGADLDARDPEGGTPLMIAAAYNLLDLAALFIDAGAGLDERDLYGRTALMYAAFNHLPEMTELLIGAGADVNAKDDSGSSALYWVTRRGHPEIIAMLRSAGAEEVELITFRGTLGKSEEIRESGRCVGQIHDGGYIITGYTGVFDVVDSRGRDILLARIGVDGREIWSQDYGGEREDYGTCFQPALDGGYIISGFTKSFGKGNGDACLIKTTSRGTEVWFRTFGGAERDTAHCVQTTPDGGFIIAGFTESFGSGERDVYLVRTDAEGEEMWAKTFGGEYWDEAHHVQQTSDGGFIAAGFSTSFGSGAGDVYLIKTDPDGGEEWSATIGGKDVFGARSVQQTADGGYIAAGFTGPIRSEIIDVYVVKTDPRGREVWSRSFANAEGEESEAFSVRQILDGGYIIGGCTRSAQDDLDFLLLKLDADGNETWSRTFGRKRYSDDEGYCVIQTADGGYAIVGRSVLFGERGHSVFLIKTDAEGHVAEAPPEE